MKKLAENQRIREAAVSSMSSQPQKTVMEGGNKSSSTGTTQKKWRLLLVVHRASQIIVSSSKADKADHKEPTEIVQGLPTSTDHSQVSIDVSFDASNGIPGDEKHLCPRRIHKEGQAHPAQGFLEVLSRSSPSM
ncbi:hypothetical protein Dsin_022227 [Dipteronia sinensis]|uniref:Uncharacterized protein n=1 Tax=Dipteronia sinensis TaxID=43782 RepID=A0AAE0A201_9ROSI|nr:hypothetical protein Dsin_022227 [Dipteronia sinensis]